MHKMGWSKSTPTNFADKNFYIGAHRNKNGNFSWDNGTADEFSKYTYWDEGHLAIIVGVGYPNGSLSHFRSMDIWATCEPDELGTTGWLGSVIQDVDPKGENVLTGVNFGRGLPRSLAKE